MVSGMDVRHRRGFLRLAGLIEGGTVLAAIALAALVGVDPWRHFHWDRNAVLIGLIGTLPLFAVYALARGTRSVAVELMGEPLSRCTWYDLLILAALAGLGEELLFRGVVQPSLAKLSPLLGVVGANLLFGAVHAVTLVYALLATGIGFYFSWLVYGFGEPNVVRAVIAHGVYDFVAFLLIVREFRQSGTVDGAPVACEEGGRETDRLEVDDSQQSDLHG